MFSDFAFVAASNATDAGSPFAGPVITSTPSRLPQVANCSTAAARKVSAAASKTDLFCPFRYETNFAVEVVFPVPFTPTIIIVVGRSVVTAKPRLLLHSQLLRALVIAASNSSPLDFLAISIISAAFLAPKSEDISDSSISAQSLLEVEPPRIF